MGLIELPEEAQKKERIATATGTVLAVGPLAFTDVGMRDVQTTMPDGSVVTQRVGVPWVEVGERVMYQRYSGARVPDPQAQDGYVPDLVFVIGRDLVCTLEKQDEEEGL